MITVESAVEGWPAATDWAALADRSVRAALAATPHGEWADTGVAIEVSVRFADDDAVRVLNRDFRHKDAATNVLSFPMIQPDLLDGLANTDDGEVLLGDIILAVETCTREAAERGVPVAAHAAHLIVHGTLHLLGHDHMTDHDAEAMEAIERDVMAALGLHDPYRVED